MKVAAALTILMLASVAFYFDWCAAVSVLTGFLWGSVNLYFIRELLFEGLMSSSKSILKVALLALLKFPLLYGGAYALLQLEPISPGYALIGLISSIAASSQKWFWRYPTRIKSEQVS